MKKSHFAAALLCLPAFGVATAAEIIIGTDVQDQYLTPHNQNKGSAAAVPLFVYPPNPENPFNFNYHYSTMPVKWTLELPEELENSGWQVTSATVTIWNAKGEGGWDPSAHEFKLFKAGVSGDQGFTRESWTEDDFWYNPSGTVQEPYLIELGTGDHAENNPDATAWAVGVVDPSYTGEAEPAEAFPVTFSLDVSNAEIRDQLTEDLNNGFSFFSIGATFPAGQPGSGGPALSYPRIVAREGVGNTEYGTIQQAPTLTIEVSTQASARNWNLY